MSGILKKWVESNSIGADLIYSERLRQIEKEEWTKAHDDRYVNDELLKASTCYIGVSITNPDERATREDVLEVIWPWDEEWFKPTTFIRNLTKAGALIAAEIDRRIRAGEKE
jgi:hypothetical protein